jgi:hypothetical protein
MVRASPPPLSLQGRGGTEESMEEGMEEIMEEGIEEIMEEGIEGVGWAFLELMMTIRPIFSIIILKIGLFHLRCRQLVIFYISED